MQITKRNGIIEEFSDYKFKKQLEFTFKNYDFLIPIFKDEVERQLKIRENISSKELLDMYINIAKNLISPLYPEFDIIAGRLLMQKKQKEVFGIKHSNQYPKFSEWVLKGAELGVYTNKVKQIPIKYLEKLDKAIVSEADYNITYVGVINFFDKYLLKVGDKQELPQLGYMRVALGVFIDEIIKPKFYKNIVTLEIINKVIKRYNDLRQGYYTEATPKWLSSLTPKPQSASCVVMNLGDDTNSINKAVYDTGLYSKYGGGIGWYGGNLRVNNSKVGLDGKSNGVVPFAKLFESTVSAYNQMGRRKGSGILWYDWFNQDIFDVVMLNDKGGAEEHRARTLKVGIVINKLLIDRAIKNKQIALFDPKEVDLNQYTDFYGFKKRYEELEKRTDLNIKFVSARDLIKAIVRQRKRTGNIYLMFKEIANGAHKTPFKDVIYQSNLCVAPETKILTDKGYKTIKKLAGKWVKIWNGKEFKEAFVDKTNDNTKLLTIETTAGVLECTPYHKFYVQQGFSKRGKIIEKRAEELNVGDKLIKFDLPIINGSKKLKLPYENGFFSGDGCQLNPTTKGIYLYDNKKELLPLFKGYKKIYENKNQSRRLIVKYDSNVLKDKFFVPDNKYTVQDRLKWLAGLLDSDGTLTKNKETQSFQICSINYNFLFEVLLMLQTLGVNSKLTKARGACEQLLPKNDGTNEKKLYKCKTTYRLLIGETGVQQLLNLGLKTYRLKPKLRKPNREATQFIKVTGIIDNERYDETYCFNEPDTHLGMFNGILTGQCSEIMFPTKPINLITRDINCDFNTCKDVVEFDIGDTWLCNLASVNTVKFMELDEDKKEEMIYRLLEAQDNIIEYSFYPTPSGEYTNKMYRPIGIGINNLAYYFAKQGIDFNSEKALKEMTKIMKELQKYVLIASNKLAKERGSFNKIKETKWSEDRWVKIFVEDFDVANEIIQSGVRFVTHFAIAPTSTSSLIIGATEGIEPITDLFTVKVTDTRTIPQVVPELRNLRDKYTLAIDIEPKQLIKLAGIRQRYMEQGQSINIYETRDKEKSYSITEEVKLWLECYKQGVKSLYYFKGRKGEEEDECLSCSS